MCYYVNLPKVTSKLAIIMQVNIQVKDRGNHNGDMETQGCIPVVSSLLREVRLRWRGVVPQRPPTPQRLTLFFGEQATVAYLCFICGSPGSTASTHSTRGISRIQRSLLHRLIHK
jgi:hypothetical protein